MNNFDVKLILNDVYCSKNCTNTIQKEVNVTTSNQTISLQCSYILNIVEVCDDYITILLQNGSNVILRNIYTTFTSEIKLPCTDCIHTISISANIISIGD